MMRPRRPYVGPIGLALLTTATIFAETAVCLKHDDGTQESKRSMTGAGHAVRFECPDDEQWYVTSIAIHGSRYGTPRAPRDKFSVVVASDDMQRVAKTAKPYSMFKRGEEEWVKFDIRPVEVPKDFQVMVFFNPTQRKGVYVGVDENSAPTHSMTVTSDSPTETKSDIAGDWMIQAFVSKSPDKKPRTLESLDDEAARVAEEAAESDAQLLGDARSLILKHDEGPMDAYLNVQGAYYTVEFTTPKDVEAYVWQVQVFGSQFGGQHDSEAVNGDVYLLNADREIISRTSFPYSLATQQQGWISIPTLPTRVHGKFYVSIDTHGTKQKGLYMGYQESEEPDHASTDERTDDVVQPGDWSDRFDQKQWMIRVKISDRPVVYQ
ncbi:MAG: hypothetical protein AAGF97_16680 [Planctomycetota bacterium]